jgi:hypothetical protein
MFAKRELLAPDSSGGIAEATDAPLGNPFVEVIVPRNRRTREEFKIPDPVARAELSRYVAEKRDAMGKLAPDTDPIIAARRRMEHGHLIGLATRMLPSDM